MIRAGGLGGPIGAALLLAAAPAHAVNPPSDTGFEIDDDAAFKAAGFKLRDDGWHACDDPGTASYLTGQIEQVADLNGDGAPEAVITESSAYCFGGAGTAYYLVSSDAAGKWRLVDKGEGFATFLKTRGKDNWPDLEVGGPGFCFPVLRWDGADYVPNRKEYEGKPCTG
jgi:hypothetical protein